MMDYCEIIFRCVLIVLMIYYVFKRKFKILKTITLVFVLSFLSVFLNAVFQVKVDAFSNFLYLTVIFSSLYLGSSLGFYDKYKWWDRSIHLLSGIGFVGFGNAIVNAASTDINKPGILIFGFTFSITLHVFWEVLEYISDCLSHGNAQRWQKVNAAKNHMPEGALQPAGLVDTMNDTICCIVGAGLAVIAWYITVS